jgi:predicted GNAT family acetyltransferase
LVHTEVNAAFRGRQIAVQLTRFGIKELRDMGFEIVAVCPFVISYMKRYPEE